MSKTLKKTLIFPVPPQSTAIIINGERSHLCEKRFVNYQHVIVTDGAWDDFSKTPIGQYVQKNASDKLTVLGDGDSIIERPKNFLHTPDQNYTDFEKALQYAKKQNLTNIDVYWANGGEIDHFLGNLSVASAHASEINIHFFDSDQCYFFLQSEKATNIDSINNIGVNTLEINNIADNDKSRTVSLYPFPEVVISSKGLRYPLDNLRLTQTGTQSLRNEAVGDIELNFKGGFWFICKL